MSRSRASCSLSVLYSRLSKLFFFNNLSRSATIVLTAGTAAFAFAADVSAGVAACCAVAGVAACCADDGVGS